MPDKLQVSVHDVLQVCGTGCAPDETISELQKSETCQDMADTIIRMMMTLPWQERPKVFHAVEHNKTFCVRCGYGEIGNENPYCQCQNDE